VGLAPRERAVTEALTSQPAVLSSYDEALNIARELGPRLKARIPEAERLRRLPDETVADFRSPRDPDQKGRASPWNMG
jgi:hypothetical protein